MKDYATRYGLWKGKSVACEDAVKCIRHACAEAVKSTRKSERLRAAKIIVAERQRGVMRWSYRDYKRTYLKILGRKK